MDAPEFLDRLSGALVDEYAGSRRILSFAEYLKLVQEAPHLQARDASQYVKDCFDYYGSEEVDTIDGPVRRYKLFDLSPSAGFDRLVGHETVQGAVYRILENFVRIGRANRLVLLHGPNGSAKSTLVSAIIRAVEDYSRTDPGAMYCFSWVFPTQSALGGGAGIGFGRGTGQPQAGAPASFASLEGEDLEARLPSIERDHPLFLLPREARGRLLADAQAANAEAAAGFHVSDTLRDGTLSHRNRQIYEALLALYHGDYLKVIRHVQVERIYVSRRYRVGVGIVEPQLSTDARSRQLTLDRSLQMLPAPLQTLSLHDVSGELVDGNRGVVEYNDLLKRPLEAFKYLLATTETGRVSLEHETLHVDALLMGTSNDRYLEAFQQTAEFASFRGRTELLRVPYLLDYRREQVIYESQLAKVQKHVAPHTAFMAAIWAVLTRMRRPQADAYEKPLADLVSELTPLEKAELYARHRAPAGIDSDAARLLEGNVRAVSQEGRSYPRYEGRIGASAREMKTVLLNASQSTQFPCVSPSAVAVELEELVTQVDIYEFLTQDAVAGYHDHAAFIAQAMARYLDVADEDIRTSLGLVEDAATESLFNRYVRHVSQFVKKEKVRDEVTGKDLDPDENLMEGVEKVLGVTDDGVSFRKGLIGRVASHALEHPGQAIDYRELFRRHLDRLRQHYYDERRGVVAKGMRSLLRVAGDGGKDMDAAERTRAEQALARLYDEHGYCPRCAQETIALLLRERFDNV